MFEIEVRDPRPCCSWACGPCQSGYKDQCLTADGRWGWTEWELLPADGEGFKTEDEAEAMIPELKTNGEDWAKADYRVVEMGKE